MSRDAVLEVAEGSIDYRIIGPDQSDHPTVLFVHGVLVDSRLWNPVADALAAQGYRCLLPTLPLGAHRTPMRRDAEQSPRSVARALHDLLVAEDEDNVTLVGNDTGGALCQFLLTMHPDRVGRVVLTNCDAFDQFPPQPFRELFRLMKRPLILRSMLPPLRITALRHSPLGFGLLTGAPDADLTRSWMEPMMTNAGVRSDLVTFLRAVRRRDLADITASMSGVEQPVAVVWGDDDRCFTPELGRRLAGTFPNATFTAAPNARTFVSLDAPDSVIDAVTQISARTA